MKSKIIILAGMLCSGGVSLYAMESLSKIASGATVVVTKGITTGVKIKTSEQAYKANKEAALELFKAVPEEYHAIIASALEALNNAYKAALIPFSGLTSIVETIDKEMIAPVSAANAKKLNDQLIAPIKGKLAILKKIALTVGKELTATPEELAAMQAALEAEAKKAETEAVKEDNAADIQKEADKEKKELEETKSQVKKASEAQESAPKAKTIETVQEVATPESTATAVAPVAAQPKKR